MMRRIVTRISLAVKRLRCEHDDMFERNLHGSFVSPDLLHVICRICRKCGHFENVLRVTPIKNLEPHEPYVPLPLHYEPDPVIKVWQ